MSKEPLVSANKQLEISMQQAASAGSSVALEQLFKALLEGPIYVPERYQEHALSDLATYPNDFINLLAIKDGERVVVPVFSEPAYIFSWCGLELRFRTFTGAELFKLLPEQWWVIINPGQELEKELSPWEVSELSLGVDSISELVSEQLAGLDQELLQLHPLEAGQYPALLSSLRAEAAVNTAISRIYVLKEEGKNLEGEELVHILVGVELPNVKRESIHNSKQHFRALCAPCLIGQEPLKIFVGSALDSDLSLSLFQPFEPIFVRKSGAGIFSKIFKRQRGSNFSA